MAVRGASDEISLQIQRLENPFLYCIYWEEVSEMIPYIDGDFDSRVGEEI